MKFLESSNWENVHSGRWRDEVCGIVNAVQMKLRKNSEFERGIPRYQLFVDDGLGNICINSELENEDLEYLYDALENVAIDNEKDSVKARNDVINSRREALMKRLA